MLLVGRTTAAGPAVQAAQPTLQHPPVAAAYIAYVLCPAIADVAMPQLASLSPPQARWRKHPLGCVGRPGGTTTAAAHLGPCDQPFEVDGGVVGPSAL